MKTSSFCLLFTSFFVSALAQQSAWAQCGGNGFVGSKSCVGGFHCQYVNDWYSQCQPGAASTTAKAATTTSKPKAITTVRPNPTTFKTSMTPSASSNGAAGGHFKWFGVDESGAEFGGDNLPGTLGKDYIFPSESSIDTLVGKGFNSFRLPFLMERMVPNTLTGSIAQDYLSGYSQIVNYITSKGAYAIVDPHNYGRYYGNVITDTAGFQSFWETVASPFKANSKVIFDTNNEYHDMDETLVLNLNQAAINGIRAAGATSQYIFAEGNHYSGAQFWSSTSDNLKDLKDPQGLLVYEMHQYLDSDGSGTSATCVSSTIGVERVEGATAWLRANGKLGIIGEYAGGANSVCQDAVKGMLTHMKQNSDVWLGALWWAGGPWWGDYIYNFEPPSGTAYTYYLSTLQSLM